MLKKIMGFSAVSLLSSAITFIFLPFITASLSIEAFADYSFFYSLTGMLTGVFTFGIFGLYSIEAAMKVRESKFSSWSLLLNFNLLACILLFVLIAVYIKLYGKNYLLLTIPGFIFFRVVFGFISHYFRVNNELRLFAGYNSLGITLMFVVPYIASVFFPDISGIQFLTVMAISLGTWSIGGIFYIHISKNLSYHFYYPTKSSNFNYCMYAGFHSLVASLVTLSDRFVLKYYASAEDFAVYSLAALLVGALSMVFSIINQNISPVLYKDLTSEKNVKSVLIKHGKNYVTIVILIFCTFQLGIASIIQVFFDNRFENTVYFARILSLGVLFQGFYFAASSILIFQKKSKTLFYLSSIFGSFGIFSSIALYHIFRVEGVVGAFILTWFLFSIATYIKALKGINNYVKNL